MTATSTGSSVPFRPETAPISVLVVDDHRVVRAGLVALLRHASDIDVIGEAGDGREAIAQVAALGPDVVLMDLQMPVMDGVEATRRIVKEWPQTAVLVLTTYDDDELIWEGMKAGARGYLLKDVPPEKLVSGLRAVASGHTLLSPAVAAKLTQMMHHRGTGDTERLLTARETEILQLIAAGQSNRRIGTTLHISENTVKTHISNIYQKLEVSDRTEAVTTALKLGLIHLP